jgi:tetratricopeptide (TPR) repeat protein
LEKQYLDILNRNPADVKAAFELASFYLRENDGNRALALLQTVETRMPDSPAVHNNMGKAHALNGDDRRARDCFMHACRLDSKFAESWFNLGDLDYRAGALEQAVDHYRKAIDIDPLMQAALNNMGNALMALKRHEASIEVFRKVVASDPDLPQGHYNLGSALRLNGQYPEAVLHLSKAIQMQPDYVDAWNNLALTCKNMGDLDRSLNYFNKALDIDPDFAVSRWNRSFVLFLKGDWTAGWRDFEWRFRVPHWRTIYPHRIGGKLWDGEPLPGRTLLIHDEQGLGDTFQFVRFLPWARQRCGRLIFETRPEVAPLLENTLGIDQLIQRSAAAPPAVPFDRYLPLMSLGGMVGVHPSRMVSSQAYISPSREKIDQWRQRVPSDGFNVGLVWGGRPEHGNDANRSCPLELFAPLFELSGFHFIGLQKGPAAAQCAQIGGWDRFENRGGELESFGDTAGLIRQLDLVLTVDTSVAHLAGAMGRPVWVLIPYIPDWRWGFRGTRTPWYPTMRLFRQQSPGDWRQVIDRIRRELLNAPSLK